METKVIEVAHRTLAQVNEAVIHHTLNHLTKLLASSEKKITLSIASSFSEDLHPYSLVNKKVFSW